MDSMTLGRLIGFFLLPFLAPMALAEGETRLNVRMEKDDYGFLAQHALVFEERGVRVVRNSNFLCLGSSDSWLGEFTLPYDSNWSAIREELTEIRKRTTSRPGLNLPSPKGPDASPHRLRAWLGRSSLEPWPSYAERVRQILQETCTSPVKPSKDLVRPQSDSSCVREGSRLRCRVEGFGQVYLAQ